MRRPIYLFSAAIVVLALGLYAFLAYSEPTPAFAARTPATQSPSNNISLAWPTHGEAAVGAVGYNILATHGTQKAQPTASVAKVMTALAVLKQYPLHVGEQGPTITITQADVNSYNTYVAEQGSVAKVALGEQITEYQALQAMLLPSADNIADTLADWSYGSISAYSSEANAMAASLGMSNTHFSSADASGYSPGTVSTAHDLLLLGQAALRNPVIAQIVAQPAATVPVAGTVRNVNWLLGKDGINGVKTGNTDQAGGVFLFSAQETFTNGQSVTVLGVIMDTSATLQQTLDESVPLLESVESNFKLTPLVTAGQVVGTYDVPWTGSVNAIASTSLSTVVWQGQDVAPTIALTRLGTPVTKGTQVGTVSYKVTKTTVPIVIDKSVPSPSWHWRFSHVF
jgi:serine-type D-Ala-D-Ala carboxypeptidase (penicillin-binding protein 5/6)